MFCYHCGKELPDGSNFCLKCGTPLTTVSAPTSKSSSPKRPIQPRKKTPDAGLSPVKTPINWIPALVFYCLITGIDFLAGMAVVGNNPRLAGTIGLLGLPLIIIGIVLVCLLHYNCWKALPYQYRYTTPGKAVGLLFIPIFNFYWAFITWPKLAEGLARWQENESSSEVTDARGVATGYAVIFICSIILGMVPGLGILVSIIDLVLFIVLYNQIVSGLNVLITS